MSLPVEFFNFPIRLMASLERMGDRPAIETDTVSLTGYRLQAMILGVAQRLAAAGVTKGDTVIVGLVDGSRVFITAMAASLLGVTWAVFEPTLPVNRLGNRVRIFSDGSLNVTGASVTTIDASWFTGPVAGGETRFPGYPDPSEICGIASSSGTTGSPKFMYRTAASVFLDVWPVVRRFTPDTVTSPRFPVGSFPGFQLLLAPLIVGCKIVMPDSNAKPEGALLRMVEAGVTHVLGSPVQIARLCAEAPTLPRKLKSLTVGGAMITPSMLRAWLPYFDEILVGYGSRESAGWAMVKIDEVVDTKDLPYEIDGEGELEVVDTEGNPVARGETGILRFRRPFMVTSYIAEPEETAAVFKGGWFHPGDLGRIDPDGSLHITGRINDQLNIGGVKFNAATVDRVACDIDGVEAAMCFSTEAEGGHTELKVCLCLKPGTTPQQVADQVRKVVREVARVDVKAIYAVPMVPVNENGKPLRRMGAALTANLEAA